jgi:5'-deoxynucleotidase YfbR-like HD superfamily hydrolase
MESRKRFGDWIQTYTGRVFWPLDPDPSEICIEDIAHSLSLQCRFLGHCKTFYSVLEHSCHVAHLVPAAYTVHGLLHDAAEAYVGDMPRPLKSQPDFATFRQIERRIQERIAKAFGIVWTDETLCGTPTP